MKQIKKLASLFLSMVMALSMCLCVSATGATPPTDSTQPGNYPNSTTNGVTNSSDTRFTITINETTAGYTYAALQIFTGDLYVDESGNKTLSNIAWGSAIDTTKAAAEFKVTEDGKERAMTASEVAEAIAEEAGTTFDSAEAQGYATRLANCLKDDAKDSAAKSVAVGEKTVDGVTTVEKYTISDLTAGYYMVINTAVPANEDYTRYMLEVVGDVAATPKTGTIEHDKYINDKTPAGVEGVDYVKANDAPIGETVDYVIPVKLPENFDSYKNYYLQFQDALMKGLELDADSIKVQVVTDKTLTDGKSVSDKDAVKAIVDALDDQTNSKDITANFNKLDREINKALVEQYKLPVTEGTLLQVWNTNLKNIADASTLFGNNTWIILTYSAELTADAVIGIPNTNYVKIVYDNNPNDTGNGEPDNPENPDPQNPKGETPNKDVETFTTELAILKTNGTEILPGVEFTLTSSNAVAISLVSSEVFVEDADGTYWKLKNGTYTLTAPVTTGGTDDTSDQYASTTQKYSKTVQLTTTKKTTGDVAVVGTVDSQGRVVFTGLGEGDYKLSETKTLPGYNTIDDIEFTITFNANGDKTFTSSNPSIIVGKGNNTFESTIINQSGSLLPSTGGIGTTIFYVVGGILVIGAGILLVTKRRMRAQ